MVFSPVTIPIKSINISPRSHLLIENISWEQYESVIEWADDIVKVSDTLNLSNYHYTYDTIANKAQVAKVPENSPAFGLLGLGALGAIYLRRRKSSFGA